MARRFRRAFYRLTPSWIHLGEGGKVLYSLGLILDAATERMHQGLLARFPGHTKTTTSLAAIGRDRRIRRGKNEAAAQYATRLRTWREEHKIRGNPFTLLRQVRAYFSSASAISCRTVDVSGNWYALAADGAESHEWGVGDWDWDGDPDAWGRFWVIVYAGELGWAEQLDLGDPELWGGALGTPGYTLGQQGASPEDVAALRTIAATWRPGGILPGGVIVALDPDLFVPGVSLETDGTWGAWSANTGGDQTPTRPATVRYFSP